MGSSLGKMGLQKPMKKYPNRLKPIMCFGFGNYPWIPAVQFGYTIPTIILTSRRWNKKGPGRVPHQARRGFIKIGCLVAVTVIGAFDQPQRSMVVGVVIVVLHCVRSFHQISLRLTSCLKTKNIYSYICIT